MNKESAAEAPKKKRSMVRGIFNTVLYIVIIGGIVFGIPRVLSWYLDTSFPMAAITSGSMWPILKTGDLIFIEGVRGKDEITVGDIIVYSNRENNTLTIHRVIEKRDDTVVTKGDANFSNDAPASYKDVIGKTFNVIGKPIRIPYMGSITVYASNFRSGTLTD